MGGAAQPDLERRPQARGEASSAQSKLLGLEILRFTCALAVLVWHYRHFYRIAGAPKFIQAEQPLHAPLALFQDYGLFGVQLFWGISGFIFFWKYGAAIAEGTVNAARFFWLRFSRLYPLHFATLLLVALLQPIHVALTGSSFIYEDNDLPNFMLQLAMATHWWGPGSYTFNGPIWSVSAEIIVYAAFFLLVARLGTGWRTIAIALILSLSGLVAGLASPALFCACYFFAGGAAAHLFLRSEGKDRATMVRISALSLPIIPASIWLSGTPLNGYTLPFILLVAMPPLLLLVAHDWPIAERWHRPIRTAGNLTYSSYLSHFPLQLIVAIGCAAAGVAPPVQSALFLIAYLAITALVSWWLFERFERPSQAWIRSMTLERRPATI